MIRKFHAIYPVHILDNENLSYWGYQKKEILSGISRGELVGQVSIMLCFVCKLRQQNVLHLRETKSIVEPVPSFYLGYHFKSFNINTVNNIIQLDRNMFLRRKLLNNAA